MPCYHPNKAYFQLDPLTGKQKAYFGEHPDSDATEALLSCGRCWGCAVMKSRDDGNRLMLESKMHEHSWFITWTYSADKVDPAHNLNFRDHELLMKRLRKARPDERIRFYTCGEYGETTSRPHFHTVLFGMSINDLIEYDTNDLGDIYYRSPELEKLWGNGFVLIGEVTPTSARYVASHLEKTLKHMEGRTHEQDEDGNWYRKPWTAQNPITGEIIERVFPATRRSNRPGIAAPWIDRYPNDINDGTLIILVREWNKHKKRMELSAKPNPVPRYLIDRLALTRPEKAEELLEARREFLNTEAAKWNSTERRLKARETCARAKMQTKQRGMREERVARHVVLPTEIDRQIHGEKQARHDELDALYLNQGYKGRPV